MEFNILLLDETLFDHATMLLSCLRFYVPEQDEWTLFKVLEDVVSLLYWDTSYFANFGSLTMLAVGCIQAVLVLTSHVNHQYPVTLRLSRIAECQPKQV